MPTVLVRNLSAMTPSNSSAITPSNSSSIPRQQTLSEPLTGGGLFSGPAIVLYIAAANLPPHLFIVFLYGIFRTEMFSFACSEHLAWVYFDHPPLVVGIAWIAHHLFGNSPLGLRLFPALAGAALVWL